MISLTYLAIDDSDLQEHARYLPLGLVKYRHALERVRRRKADIVVLYRADGTRELRNTYWGKLS